MNAFILLSLLWTNTPVQDTLPVSETKIITGHVMDQNSEPLVLASVEVKYLNISTRTDMNGWFSLTLPDTCSRLEVSYVGYISQEVDIRNTRVLKIVLDPGFQLETIVVTAFKVPLEKRSLATSVSTIQQAQMIHVNGSRDRAAVYSIDEARRLSGETSGMGTGKSDEDDSPYHTEDYSRIKENTFQTPADAPLSTFSIDVDAASYANVFRHPE